MKAALLAALALGLAGCDEPYHWDYDTFHTPDGDADADADADADGDGDGDADGDGDGDADADADLATAPWVEILSPGEGEEAPNPVRFEFAAGDGVATVAFSCEGWPLHDGQLPAAQGSFTYDFSGVNRSRTVDLVGYDGAGAEVARDAVTFVPFEEACALSDQAGFNHYTVAAINDTSRFPRNGTYPYCWGESWCGENWGQIHDGVYGGELLFPGGGDCFCSGHTLEVFLRAFGLFLAERGLPDTTLFRVGGNELSVDSVDIGDFYQWWQGFGVASYSSSAEAFAQEGIGEVLDEGRWDEALPGDYVNLSRTTGSGHAVIFVDWVWEGGERAGLRYYGCNNSGDSCPDPGDPLNTGGNSGPGFITEHFSSHGGTVMPEYLFIGRVFMPEG